MEIDDIVFLIVFAIIIIIGWVTDYYRNKLYKQRDKVFNESVEYIQEIYSAVMPIIIMYYVDLEDFENANLCKKIMDKMKIDNEEFNLYKSKNKN